MSTKYYKECKGGYIYPENLNMYKKEFFNVQNDNLQYKQKEPKNEYGFTSGFLINLLKTIQQAKNVYGEVIPLIEMIDILKRTDTKDEIKVNVGQTFAQNFTDSLMKSNLKDPKARISQALKYAIDNNNKIKEIEIDKEKKIDDTIKTKIDIDEKKEKLKILKEMLKNKNIDTRKKALIKGEVKDELNELRALKAADLRDSRKWESDEYNINKEVEQLIKKLGIKPKKKAGFEPIPELVSGVNGEELGYEIDIPEDYEEPSNYNPEEIYNTMMSKASSFLNKANEEINDFFSGDVRRAMTFEELQEARRLAEDKAVKLAEDVGVGVISEKSAKDKFINSLMNLFKEDIDKFEEPYEVKKEKMLQEKEGWWERSFGKRKREFTIVEEPTFIEIEKNEEQKLKEDLNTRISNLKYALNEKEFYINDAIKKNDYNKVKELQLEYSIMNDNIKKYSDDLRKLEGFEEFEEEIIFDNEEKTIADEIDNEAKIIAKEIEEQIKEEIINEEEEISLTSDLPVLTKQQERERLLETSRNIAEIKKLKSLLNAAEDRLTQLVQKAAIERKKIEISDLLFRIGELELKLKGKK